MSLLIYTDSTMLLEAEFFATRELIAISDSLFVSEWGYTRFSSSPQSGLDVAYLGISLLPNVSTDVDTNNVYINILPKLSGPGSLLTAPILRKLYQGIDWAFVGSTDININISDTGPNSDIKLYVGSGDKICIAPLVCSNISPSITTPVGTLAASATQLWLKRQIESGQQFTYDQLQISAVDSLVTPTVIYAKDLTAVTRVVDIVNSTITLVVSDAANWNGRLNGCNVYFGNKLYAGIVNTVADSSSMVLTLTRVPETTQVLLDASTDFKITAPGYISSLGITFSSISYSSLMTTTSGSNVITGIGSTATVYAGQKVTGPGIVDGTYVLAIIDTSSVRVSQNAVTDGTNILSFDGSLGQGMGFVNLDIASFIGYGVTHLAKYIGTITGHGVDYVVLGDTAYASTIAEDAELIFLSDLQFALDNGFGAPVLPYVPILNIPAVTTDNPISFWVTGRQLVKTRPYVLPNYQIVVSGTAYPV